MQELTKTTCLKTPATKAEEKEKVVLKKNGAMKLEPGTYFACGMDDLIKPVTDAWNYGADGCYEYNGSNFVIFGLDRNGEHYLTGEGLFGASSVCVFSADGAIAIAKADLLKDPKSEAYSFITPFTVKCEKSCGFIFLRVNTNQKNHWLRITHVSRDDNDSDDE
jgi:hypothetical protein